MLQGCCTIYIVATIIYIYLDGHVLSESVHRIPCVIGIHHPYCHNGPYDVSKLLNLDLSSE
jgi:hypothetical protein